MQWVYQQIKIHFDLVYNVRAETEKEQLTIQRQEDSFYYEFSPLHITQSLDFFQKGLRGFLLDLLG